VFDVNRGGLSHHSRELTEYEEQQACLRILRCHRGRVKRVITENSPEYFLTAAEVSFPSRLFSKSMPFIFFTGWKRQAARLKDASQMLKEERQLSVAIAGAPRGIIYHCSFPFDPVQLRCCRRVTFCNLPSVSPCPYTNRVR